MGEPMTKQRLSQYIYLKMEVEHQLERLARLRNQERLPAMQESDSSKQSGSGTGDRMERAIIRRMEYEDRVMPQVEAAMAEMQVIEDAIRSLPNPMEREVLRLRYMEGTCLRHLPWRDVALRLFGDDDDSHMMATYRLHTLALQKISEKNVSKC